MIIKGLFKWLRVRIRKLTEIECFKLMGFKAEDCLKCIAVDISRTQLYKGAGNGICTPCVKLLFQHLFKAQENPAYACEDEKMFTAGC